jgi:hypothetical protein
MQKVMIIPASLFALLTLSGPSVANVPEPCAKSAPGEPKLICFCQPGGQNCKCNKVATDETGVETW